MTNWHEEPVARKPWDRNDKICAVLGAIMMCAVIHEMVRGLMVTYG